MATARIETRGKLTNSQSLHTLLYYHSQCNFLNRAKYITMQLQIQMLHTGAQAKYFISAVHYSMHGVLKSFLQLKTSQRAGTAMFACYWVQISCP